VNVVFLQFPFDFGVNRVSVSPINRFTVTPPPPPTRSPTLWPSADYSHITILIVLVSGFGPFMRRLAFAMASTFFYG
jgi:hypothetical protein